MSIPDLLHHHPFLRQALTPADQQKLLDVIRTARHSQENEYRIAIDQALSHVPALLRGSILKIVMG